MKKAWINPEIEAMNVSETAQGINPFQDDGSVLFGCISVGPICPTQPTTTNPDDPS